MKMFVIGCGSIGRRHTANLRKLGVDDIVVFDPDRERAEALARDCGALAVESIEQGYDKKPRAVLVCAPTSMHLDLASEAIQHGCHVFLEKPLAHALDGVSDFIESIRARNKVVLVGYNLRFDPLLRRVHQMLDAGCIGRLLSASLSFGSYLPWRHPWEDYRVGYGARRELGGGVILDAIHEMDYAQWLFGSPSSLYCISGKYSDLEIDVEDLAEILLAYPDKLVSIHLDYIAQPAHRTCTILGTWGQLRVDLVERRLRHFDGETREWSTIPVDGSISESYEAEMRHFLDCIEGSAKPEVDAECARQSLEIAEAARRSMLLGSPVTVESMVEVASEVMS